mgnify:CR=1 FL=1
MKRQHINRLKKLNPKHSIFGRLFLWFWLATIVLITSSIWLSHQFTDHDQIRPVDQKQQKVLQKVTERIDKLNQRARKPKDLKKLAYHLGRNFNYDIVIYDVNNNTWLTVFPDGNFRYKKRFERMLAYDTPLTFNVGRMTFSGPIKAINNQQPILVYVGKHKKGSAVHNFRENHPGWFIFIVLTISALLCLFMAWSINKPLKALQETVQQMASGNLSARVDNADSRHDEIGKLSQDINFMAEQVQSSINAQKRLIADISHELRSPLARLQIVIGIAQQASENNPKDIQVTSLQRIEKEADEIESMITQVLALSRLEANQQSFDFETVNLTSLVEQIAQDANFEASAQGKKLTSHLDSNVKVKGDGQLLSRAFENLTRNAVKYANNDIDILLSQEANKITFTVIDDGTGVSENEIDKIFTPFYRASASRNRESGGVGLGLAITRSAVHIHQGNITAANVEPHGLNVTVTLPVNTSDK